MSTVALVFCAFSIAHVNPTFVFDELVVTHYCGSAGGLSGLVLSALTQQAVAQGYKVVGSMELLGDPLSLVSKVWWAGGVLNSMFGSRHLFFAV